jgi:hypothetical protein
MFDSGGLCRANPPDIVIVPFRLARRSAANPTMTAERPLGHRILPAVAQ